MMARRNTRRETGSDGTENGICNNGSELGVREYRATHQVDLKVLLTSKQQFRFSSDQKNVKDEIRRTIKKEEGRLFVEVVEEEPDADGIFA